MSFQLKPVLACLTVYATFTVALYATTYVVDQAKGDDRNSGLAGQSWKSLTRAGTACELKPGDTVLVKRGIYHEQWTIRVKGAPGKPVIFRSEGEVVVTASEVVDGPWEKQGKLVRRKLKEERFWKDPKFADARERENRFLSMLVYDREAVYRLVGRQPVYNDSQYITTGSGPEDVVERTFFFDPKHDWLYLHGGPPYGEVRVGVRGFALKADGQDYELHGFTFMGPNRQRGASWPLCSVNGTRWLIKDCRFLFADYSLLGHIKSTDSKVIGCELAYGASVGHALALCSDIEVSDCWMHHNGFGPFTDAWGVRAGAKHIPDNRNILVRNCLIEQNGGIGIWFDSCGSNISVEDCDIRFNSGPGIHFEVSKGNHIAKGNRIYRNGDRGVYVRATPSCRIQNNLIVENRQGVAVTEDCPDTRVTGNTVVNNRAGDMILWQGKATSDHNLFQADAIFCEGWENRVTRAKWQESFDQNSQFMKSVPIAVKKGSLIEW